MAVVDANYKFVMIDDGKDSDGSDGSPIQNFISGLIMILLNYQKKPNCQIQTC